MSTPTEPLLLDYHQTAALLNISKPTLERMVRAKTIPVVRLGRSVRFPREDLTEWLKGLKKGGATDEQ